MEIQCRTACSNDYEKIQRLQRQVHDLHVKNRPDHFKDSQTALGPTFYESLVNDENTTVLIMEAGDEAVAYGVLIKREIHDSPIMNDRIVVILEAICVDERYKRQGVGKKLVQAAAEFAKAAGATALELGVYEFNQDAIRFYESMGFRPFSRKMELSL